MPSYNVMLVTTCKDCKDVKAHKRIFADEDVEIADLPIYCTECKKSTTGHVVTIPEGVLSVEDL